MERVMSDSLAWREIRDQVHFEEVGLCMLRKRLRGQMCVLLLCKLRVGNACRGKSCVKTGIGEYKYAKKCVGGSLECTAWRHLHRYMLECAE